MGDLLLEIEEKGIIKDNKWVDIKVTNNTKDALTYKILAGKDGIWDTISDFDKNENGHIEWVPKEEGNYMIIAQARRKDSKKPFDYKVSQSITIGDYDDKLIKDLYIEKNKFKIGDKITIKVEGYKSPLMFRYFIGSKQDWKLIKDYTPEDTITYTANRSGEFEFLVECKIPESTHNFDDFRTIPFKVCDFERPEITDFKCLTKEMVANNQLTFEVKGSFEDDRTALYKFVKINSDGKGCSIQDYSSKNTISFEEEVPGKYKLLCLIKDMYSNREYDDRAVMVYEVKPYKAINLKTFDTDLNSPQVIGSNILIKALAKGGKNLLYRFKIDGPIGEDSGFSKNTTFLWEAKAEGEYLITLLVKDESFKGEYETLSQINYVIDKKRTKPIKIADIVFSKEKNYIKNEPINVKVITDGGKNTRYSFEVTRNEIVIASTAYSDKNWIEFIPREAGEYKLEIKIKDKYSEKEYDTHTNSYFRVKEYLEANIEHILLPSNGYFLVGDKVDIEIITENTKDTLIKYITKINEQIVEETDYEVSKKINIIPKCSGKYTVEIYAKNKKCITEYDSKKEVKFYVNDCLPITSTRLISEKKEFKLNEEITLNVESDGGTEVCYEYYIMKDGDWNLVQNYSRKDYYTFRALKEGNYRVLVLAKSHYKKCAYEDYDMFEFKVI